VVASIPFNSEETISDTVVLKACRLLQKTDFYIERTENEYGKRRGLVRGRTETKRFHKRSCETRGPTRGLLENPTVTIDTKAVNVQRNYWLRKLHGGTVRN